MIARPFWIDQVRSCWKKASIVWLSGVRRVGKTTLARELGDAEFLNCDIPSSQHLLSDPEVFYRSLDKPVLVLDEVHQLADPSRLLKIGADEFPGIKILATGSSTLAATSKFRDSLAGRKRSVHLVPVLHGELEAFGIRDLRRRLLHGGLPPALLARDHDPGFFSEWLDSYFARDVQELFRVEKRGGFLKLVEGILRMSGGQMEATALASLCGLSRPTVLTYLEVMELTHVAAVIRPFSGGGKRELVRQPKIYGFDTGFVAFARGWSDLRPEDCGILWEHLVLERLQADLLRPRIQYWRDKDRYEVDFVIPCGRRAVNAIECKWDAGRFDPTNLRAFRAIHREGTNFVVAANVRKPYTREVGGLTVTFAGIDHENLTSHSGPSH